MCKTFTNTTRVLLFALVVFFISLTFSGKVLADCCDQLIWGVWYCSGNCDSGATGYPPCQEGCSSCCPASGCWCEEGGSCRPGCCNGGLGCCCSGSGGGGCFVGETQIATPGGQKAISDIKEGDTVVGLDTQTNEKVETQVESVYELEREGYYEVTVEKPDGTEEVLKVTGEHPLFVKKQSPIANIFQTILTKILNLTKKFGI